MFLRKNWLPISVFIVAIAGVCVYMLATQPEKPPIKIYKTVKPTEKPTAEVPSETDKGGHYHADGTWHADEHKALGQPVSQESQPHRQESPSVIAQGKTTYDPNSETHPSEVERIARYQQRVEQYRKDLELWRQKHSQAYLEWMQASEIDRKSPEEWEMERAYVQSLSDVEKQEYVAKMQAKFERSIDAWERLRTLMKEEPVFPNASQAK